MRKIQLLCLLTLFLGGCGRTNVYFREYVPQANLRFTPESRVALLWSAKRTLGLPSDFYYEIQVENSMLLAAVDRELTLQSKGVFNYIPNRQLKQNTEEAGDAFQLKLIQDNQLDGALSTHLSGRSTITWPEDDLFGNLLFLTPLAMSVRDQKNQEIALARILFLVSLKSLEQPTQAHWETRPDGTKVRVPGTRWDKHAYYNAIAKLYVKKVIKYFKEGTEPREEVPWLVKRSKEQTGIYEFRTFNDLELRNLFKDDFPALIPEP